MSKFALVKRLNKAYRDGEALVSDKEYDELYDSLTQEEQTAIGVGGDVEATSRKQKLPMEMRSMDKAKTIDEIKQWIKSKSMPLCTEFVVTPKYDGLSFLTLGDNGYTRGDGVYGQRSDKHLEMLNRNKDKVTLLDGLVFGEVIMRKKTFNEKYANMYANGRNLVAGLFNKKDPNEAIKDVEYVCYGIDGRMSKIEQLDMLNKNQDVQVPYEVMTIKDITHESLEELYNRWSELFEIDGVIIETNGIDLRESLGREKNDNPAYARAYKGFTENTKETTLLDVQWSVAKDGRLAPVGILKPISLDGVVISRVTLIHAKFVKDNNITIGSRLGIVRSGAVIPKVISIDGNVCK